MSSRARSLTALLALTALVVGTAKAETIQQGNLIVEFGGRIKPKKLPRSGLAPVRLGVGGQISTTDGKSPPQLRRVVIEVNRRGKMDARGLPKCPRGRLEGRTSAEALKLCRKALVGRGHVSAEVALPEQSPFPSEGRVLAFNGHYRGRSAVIAHIYGKTPLPITVIIPFRITRAKGQFGTRLFAQLPVIASDWGYVTSINMSLGRRFRAEGRARSYLSAGCPAPRGFPGALFNLARARYEFADGSGLETVLTRNCKAKGD